MEIEIYMNFGILGSHPVNVSYTDQIDIESASAFIDSKNPQEIDLLEAGFADAVEVAVKERLIEIALDRQLAAAGL